MSVLGVQREEAILNNRAKEYANARERKPERWTRQTRNWTPIGEVHLNPDLRPQAKGDAA